MFHQQQHGVGWVLASDKGHTPAAPVEAQMKVCTAALAARSVLGKAGCPLGAVTRLSQWVTGCLS